MTLLLKPFLCLGKLPKKAVFPICWGIILPQPENGSSEWPISTWPSRMAQSVNQTPIESHKVFTSQTTTKSPRWKIPALLRSLGIY